MLYVDLQANDYMSHLQDVTTVEFDIKQFLAHNSK